MRIMRQFYTQPSAQCSSETAPGAPTSPSMLAGIGVGVPCQWPNAPFAS